MKYLLLFVPMLFVGLMFPVNTYAQNIDAVVAADIRKDDANEASQQRIDDIVSDTRDLTTQYQTTVKEIDGLKVYNTLLERQAANQEREIDLLISSIDKVTVIERQIMPLMQKMIDALEHFVALDVPFLLEERRSRSEFLKTLLERSDVTVAEKYRRIVEAYQIENDYGRTIEAYKGSLDIDDKSWEVDFLRMGRIGLFYQNEDGSISGAWDQANRTWIDLGNEYRGQIRDGLRIAKKQIAPDLLLLPFPAAEDAQ